MAQKECQEQQKCLLLLLKVLNSINLKPRASELACALTLGGDDPPLRAFRSHDQCRIYDFAEQSVNSGKQQKLYGGCKTQPPLG